MTCSADDKSCFKLSLADGADGIVKEIQIPRLESDMEEEFGVEDPTKWKLDKVEAFKDDALLWPTGNTKNNATLQNVMSTAKADCQGKDADADILMFTFDWSADPTQDARRADSQKWRTWQKAGALLGLLENACYIVVDVYLGYVVFGSSEGIAEKKEHMSRVRLMWLVTYVLWLLVDAVLLAAN